LGTSLSLESQAILYELSFPSGGVSYKATTLKQREANEIFEAIANELRNQYTIGIVPFNSSYDEKWHRIKLKVNSPVDSPREMRHLSARTREGYYWK
jgi:hypothetical protein